ncbi:MAG: M20/M25/M40 family metallo-hydrolase [SAR202 cluster bacterium]|nr:M20/M25/M40 family metallo-hydrolase [SAR202 cluster bacterium]|tara:strand:- start:4451 stop:5527 length:1077 start_codon:yes stop_codon:yes gene_type:complete
MIRKERLLETLFDLIRIDSPSGEESNIIEEVKRRLESLGVQCEIDSYGNLLGHSGCDNPILLSAHLDTVEPGRGIHPRVDGLYIVSQDTTILGADCKAGVASVIEGITSLIEDGKAGIDFEIAFTKEEEIGLVGARNLDYSKITSKEAIVFDGRGAVTQITSASPTHMRFEVNVKGRAAHAGVEPEKGVSAIKIASELINRLPQGRIDDTTTFNIGVLEGGSVTNAVPETALIKGEFRSQNHDTIEMLSSRVKDMVNETQLEFPDSNIDLNFELDYETYSRTGFEPSVVRVINALKTLGLQHEMIHSGGGSDGNIFISRGIDSAVIGIGSYNAHTVREYVVIDELLNVARVCEQLLRK